MQEPHALDIDVDRVDPHFLGGQPRQAGDPHPILGKARQRGVRLALDDPPDRPKVEVQERAGQDGKTKHRDEHRACDEAAHPTKETSYQ